MSGGRGDEREEEGRRGHKRSGREKGRLVSRQSEVDRKSNSRSSVSCPKVGGKGHRDLRVLNSDRTTDGRDT